MHQVFTIRPIYYPHRLHELFLIFTVHVCETAGLIIIMRHTIHVIDGSTFWFLLLFAVHVGNSACFIIFLRHSVHVVDGCFFVSHSHTPPLLIHYYVLGSPKKQDNFKYLIIFLYHVIFFCACCTIITCLSKRCDLE